MCPLKLSAVTPGANSAHLVPKRYGTDVAPSRQRRVSPCRPEEFKEWTREAMRERGGTRPVTFEAIVRARIRTALEEVGAI